MDVDALHDLTPAYALDALDREESEAYEAHLARCEQCQEELALLSDVSTALAYAAPAVSPPPALRSRILDAAKAERSNVVPLRPRWARPVAAVAAVAACAVVGLAAWNVSLHDRLGHASAAPETATLSGAKGSVVVDGQGSGTLVVADLASAPTGKTYEAWVIKGAAATPAGTFASGGDTTVVHLAHAVPRGSIVAVTVERAGGTSAPTVKPFIVSATV